MTNLKINNKDYKISDGIIINQKYNEELDSATVSIPFSDKLNISPYDFVEITDERFGTLYFLIDTWVETTVSVNPIKYNYDINLISETIKLQKIVLPNLTITHPMGKSPKSISKKLEECYLTYIYPQYNELSLDSSIYELVEDCPEEEFNRPTAFEFFNTLMAKVNCVVKVTNHKIGFIRLDKYGEKIDESKLYYNNNTQTIKDYANRLDVQVANGITERKNYSSIAGITLRANEGESIINDDNMLIFLEKDIYDIGEESNVFVYVPYTYTANNETINGVAKLDITDKIVEKAVYDTYLASNDSLVVGNYKRDALYYVRGQNTIEGLTYTDNIIGGATSNIALYTIIKNKLSVAVNSNANPDFSESAIRESVYFLVEYKTNENFRFVVEKDNNYNATLIDNQIETQVDVLNFGKTEQDKLNRLGNKNQIINATYYYDDYIPNLGDYIGEYILAEREVVYYKNFSLFKGYLYKNYVRKNMFYGLNSKKRSTQIATESVVRNDVFNYDVTFHLSRVSFDPLIRYILMPLSVSGYPDQTGFIGYDYYEFPKYCIYYSYSAADLSNILKDENDEEYEILTSPSSFTCGKSNVIQFRFMDNYSAGMMITDNAIGGKTQQYVKYTDDYGEVEGIYFSLSTNKRKELVENATTKSELQSYKEFSNSLPKLTRSSKSKIDSNFLFSQSKKIYKDNRETLAITININYKDSENVVVGKFAEYTGIGYRYNIAYYNIGIVTSTKDEYDVGDEYGLGTLNENLVINWTDGIAWMTSEGVTNTLDNLSLRTLDGSEINKDNMKSWGIVEKDTGRLILGVNKANEDSIPTTIYLKVEEKPY